jgi:hypothetical protein
MIPDKIIEIFVSLARRKFAKNNKTIQKSDKATWLLWKKNLYAWISFNHRYKSLVFLFYTIQFFLWNHQKEI